MNTDKSNVDSKLLSRKEEFLRRNAAFYYSPVSFQQFKTTADRPARGPIWVSRTSFPPVASNDITHALHEAIRDLGSGGETYEKPIFEDVKVQWTGYRSGAGPTDPEPNIEEREKYRHLTEDLESDTVIYYIHGGFHCTGGSAASRAITAPLSTRSGGRVVSLDYRLCPQNPFPAALIDAFVGYLSLLHPPKGSFHESIKPEQIVFAGDSAGASLAAALLQLIRHIQDSRRGGHSEASLKFDFLTVESPYMCDKTPDCAIWPAHPPRGEMYCETSMLCHPLVSPLISRSWEGFPPMFLAFGEDHLGGQGAFVAGRALENGVTVEFHKYEHQMHVFPGLFPDYLPSMHLVRQMATFAERCVKDRQSIKSRKVLHPPTVDTVEDVELEVTFPDEDFGNRLAQMRAKQSERKPWTGAKLMATL
ncbi:MAG: hypothetical protein Q9160_005644 [Pyrenula sp. 1 TL-2023]